MRSIKQDLDAVYATLNLQRQELRLKMELDEEAAMRATVKAAETRKTAEEDLARVEERAQEVSVLIREGDMRLISHGPLSLPLGLDTDLRDLPTSGPLSPKKLAAGFRTNNKHHEEIAQDITNLANKIQMTSAEVDAATAKRRKEAYNRRRKMVRDKKGLWLLVEARDPNVRSDDDSSDDEGMKEFRRQEALARQPPIPRRNNFSMLDHMDETWNEGRECGRRAGHVEEEERDGGEDEDEDEGDEDEDEEIEDEHMKDEDMMDVAVKQEAV